MRGYPEKVIINYSATNVKADGETGITFKPIFTSGNSIAKLKSLKTLRLDVCYRFIFLEMSAILFSISQYYIKTEIRN